MCVSMCILSRLVIINQARLIIQAFSFKIITIVLIIYRDLLVKSCCLCWKKLWTIGNNVSMNGLLWHSIPEQAWNGIEYINLYFHPYSEINLHMKYVVENNNKIITVTQAKWLIILNFIMFQTYTVDNKVEQNKSHSDIF